MTICSPDSSLPPLFVLLQPDGIPGGDLEQPLMLRQQLEGSELPNEFKRAQLGATPFWEEVLLDLNRTVKVSYIPLAGMGQCFSS